jgi:hypothetical protein
MQFWGVLGAVLLGNGLTIAYVYALQAMSKLQREGRDLGETPFLIIVAGAAGPLIAAACMYVTFY